jgi:hypothetical protein
MSENPGNSPASGNSVSSETEPSSENAITSSLPAVPIAEQELETIIRDLPAPQKEKARETIRELFMGVIERSSGPKLDPETVKVIAASVDKDNERKFQYLSQKQKDQAEQDKLEHTFTVQRHNDRMGLLRPIIYIVIVAVVACMGMGIYFSAEGHEVLGASLLTGAITGVFAFLAGLGTSDIVKGK